MHTLSVVKIGGNVIDNPRLYKQFLSDFAKLPSPKILVHGGGKIATQIAVKLDVETVMVEGRRITDEKMLEVVTMVYGGLVNKRFVAHLQALGCNSIGLTGADAGIVRSRKRTGWAVDYGFVGDIEEVNAAQIINLLNAGLTPIFAPLTYDIEGNLLNTNADTQAQAIATALAKNYEVSLVYCFEKKGVLSNPNDDDSVISQLNPSNYATYKTDGAINTGMIPKLDNAFKALQEGVVEVIICHAQDLQKAEKGTKLVLS